MEESLKQEVERLTNTLQDSTRLYEAKLIGERKLMEDNEAQLREE